MSDYIVLYVNKLLVSKESAVFLLSFVIGSKKIKIAGNFFYLLTCRGVGAFWLSRHGCHLVDNSRDDGKLELAMRRKASKPGGGSIDDVFDGCETQKHFQSNNV